jgi:undecaprenyl-diphosphatase
MMRRTAALTLLLLAAAYLPAERFTIVGVPDGIALAGSVLLAGFSQLLPYAPHPDVVDPGVVNGFDRLALFAYAPGFDTASDALQYACVAAPLALALFLNVDAAATAGFLYLEAISVAVFAKNTGKYLVPRVRPWVYLAADGHPLPSDPGGNDSFPSGHATVAFAAAAFGVSMAAAYFPGAPWLGAFAAADLGMAVLTATFRVFAGMHFMTDVIAGAALGSAIGALVPLLHQGSAGINGGSPSFLLPVRVSLVTIAMEWRTGYGKEGLEDRSVD